MAFDGFVVAALADELNNKLSDGRIYKIVQPEPDEILLTIRKESDTRYVLISVNPSLPLVYITEEKKQAPMSAPNFCMLLRKYISNARISKISQPGLERILIFELSYRDEMGDLLDGRLIIEMMGKHSNIIFVRNDDIIIDSIKHISLNVSSVREVLPGRKYFVPNTENKKNPLDISREEFDEALLECSFPVSKALYSSFTGISPLESNCFCVRASIDLLRPFYDLSDIERLHLYSCFDRLISQVKESAFAPCIVYENDEPAAFSAFSYIGENAEKILNFDSISKMLVTYYGEKEIISRIRQRSSDLRKIVQVLYERTVKKYDIQLKQMNDTQKMEKFRIWGEMINTYGYDIKQGAKELVCMNYYDNQEIKVPLNPDIPVMENAKVYFGKYTKLKRTRDALTGLLKSTKDALDYLDSIVNALSIARSESDLIQIKEELLLSGYIKQRGPVTKKQKVKNKPMHFLSSDGYDIYVGKNNIQNEEITHKMATGGDWWFHAKQIAGSHVVLKCGGELPPDKSFVEAAALAAHFSKAGSGDKAEVDYVEKKFVKKPAGAAIGFVIYHTNYSMLAGTDISGIKQIS